MSIVMKRSQRLAPEESRRRAVNAARDLLQEEGIAAITLKAVGARVGRTHANLLHHFGSVAGLHAALAHRIATDVAVEIERSIGQMQRGETHVRDMVGGMFEAFEREKVGELIAWVVMTGQRGALEPIVAAIGDVVTAIRTPDTDRPIDRATCSLVLMAIGNSLAGGEVARACGLDAEAVRDIAVHQLVAILEGRRPR